MPNSNAVGILWVKVVVVIYLVVEIDPNFAQTFKKILSLPISEAGWECPHDIVSTSCCVLEKLSEQKRRRKEVI